MWRQFSECLTGHLGEILFIVVSFLPQTSGKRPEPLKEFQEYPSTDLKSSVVPWRNRSSNQGLANHLFAPDPYAARFRSHWGRLPTYGGRASPLRFDLRDHLPGFERTTIPKRFRNLSLLHTEYLLLANPRCIGSLSLAGGPGSQARKNPLVSEAPKVARRATDRKHPLSHHVVKDRRGSIRQYGFPVEVPLETERQPLRQVHALLLSTLR